MVGGGDAQAREEVGANFGDGGRRDHPFFVGFGVGLQDEGRVGVVFEDEEEGGGCEGEGREGGLEGGGEVGLGCGEGG